MFLRSYVFVSWAEVKGAEKVAVQNKNSVLAGGLSTAIKKRKTGSADHVVVGVFINMFCRHNY